MHYAHWGGPPTKLLTIDLSLSPDGGVAAGLQALDDGLVRHGGGVAEVGLARRDLAQDAAHDLAGAGLGKVDGLLTDMQWIELDLVWALHLNFEGRTCMKSGEANGAIFSLTRVLSCFCMSSVI